MRHLKATGFICLVLLLAASVASADMFPIAQDPGQCVIWSQRPDMNDDPALNWSSTYHQHTIAANDWHCYGAGEIYEVHWWGCLLGSQTVQPDGFLLVQYDHAGSTPFSKPGNQLCMQAFANYQVAQVPGTDIWEYYIADLNCIQDPVLYGTDMYFLAIVAVYNDPDPNYNWGWHEAVDVRYDYSVQVTAPGPVPDWQHIWRDGDYRDLAFEMSGQCDKAPEPATLSLLVMGLGAIGLRLRRRKDS